ncbi:MAG: PAS domain-containing protein, partial [Paramuribaculum sp.]|nr:PAS domain-containing protein [Paramuribaculum sp.]
MRAKWIFAVIVILILGITIAIIASPKLILTASVSDIRLYAGGICLVLLLLLRFIYLNLLRPINAIFGGMELVRTQDFSSRLVKVGQKDADKLVGLFNKMIDSLKQERIKNMEQNHFLQLLIQSSPSGIAILDFDGAITHANPAMLALMNTDEETAIGKMPEALAGELPRAIGEVAQGQTATVRLSDNMIVRISRLSFMETGFTRPFITVEVLTDEVRNAEKEAYGKVIRIIAHEVNNT